MSAIQQENSDLVNVLISNFETLIKNKDQQREIDDILITNHGIPRGTLDEIMINTDKLEQISKDELIVLTLVLHQVTKDENIVPSKFYTEKEIKKATKFKFEQEEEITLPVTYEKVLMGSESDYVVKMSYREIANTWNSLWTYNYDTQRNPVKKAKKDGTFSIKPKINPKSVKQIKELMLEKKYKPDVIVVNVMMDGTDEIFYNEEEMELTIEKASEINLIDGFHRTQAVLAALEENPDLEGYLYVSIRNYDLEMARFYLGQHNSFNTFDKTHIRKLKSLNISDKIVEDLDMKSDLKGRITTSTAVKRKLNEITNFAILSDTIKLVFDPKTGKDRLDFSYALIRFFDYLFGSYPEAFVTNVEETFKKSWINHHNTFVGYIVLAKKLYDLEGKDFNVDNIVKVVDSIEFSKESGEFNDLMTTQGKVNSNQVKEKIRKFFQEKADKVLG